MSRKITILTVSWYSTELLQRLLNNLSSKAAKPQDIDILVVDNTNGRDKSLGELNIPGVNLSIIHNDPGNLKGLYAHSHGLNSGFAQLESEFVLTVDPDIYVFKQNWDSFLLEIITSKDIDSAGTGYPPWWLGTYHNFPSPIFCMAKTQSLKNTCADWSPPQVDIIVKIRNFLIRQLLRGCFIFNRRQLTRHRFLRKITKSMERALPICTLDTGYQLSRKKNLKSIIFESLYPDEIPLTVNNRKKTRECHRELAEHFEFYCYENEPVLTHQYGSQNFLLKTAEGRNRDYWLNLIEKIEKPDAD